MTAERSPIDLAHAAPCGLVAMSIDGVVLAANALFIERTGRAESEVVGTYFVRLLTSGSRLYYETHFEPMLRMHDGVNEAVLHLARPGQTPQAVLVTAAVDRSGDAPLIRTAVFDATTRVKYEHQLRETREAAEESLLRLSLLEQAASGLAGAATSEELEAALGTVASSATGTRATAMISPATETAGVPPRTAREPRSRSYSSPLPSGGGDRSRHVIVWAFDQSIDVDEQLSALLTAFAQQAGPVLDRVHLLERVEHQAMHDELTGLPNRAHMNSRLAEAIAAAQRNDSPLSLLYLDLDGFKLINDSRGHAAGDAALREFAVRFTVGLRAEDTIARLGGDEFVVLCEETDADAAKVVAERLRGAASAPLPGSLSTTDVAASVGIVTAHPPAPFTAESLLHLADEAMYEAKRLGTGISTRQV